MPIIAPIVGFLGTTAGAVTASAVIGAGTALLNNNASRNANRDALAAQTANTDKSLAAQQAALDRITGINQPFINAGQSVLSPLAARVNAGAPNFSAPSYARPLGSSAPARQLPSGEETMGGPAPLRDRAIGVRGPPTFDAKTPGGFAGTSPAQPDGGAPAQATGPDWDAYIAANPDVAAWIQAGHGDPNLGPNQTPEQAAAYQFHNTGQSEGRAAPPNLAPPAQGPAPNAAPPQPLDLGTASPVVGNFTRPDQPTAPSFGASPNAASFLDPNNFQASPDYQWRLQQGQRNLNANYGARGLLKSGGAIEGAIDYGQHQASGEFANWFGRQQQLYQDTANQYNTDRASGLNQFNLDRNNVNNNFSEDRSYGTNLAISNRDFANNQYNTQTQNLFQLAGVGANAAAAIGGANNNYANNAANLYTNQGNNAADAAYNRGSAQQQLYGTIGSTAANLFSSPSRYTGGTPLPLQTSTFSAPTISAPNAFATNLTQVPSYNYGGY